MDSRKRARRLLTALFATIAIVGAVIYALKPKPVAVDVATAYRGTLRETIDTEAKTRVRDRYIISAPVSGQLSRIALDEGDHVTSGQIVAHIDPLPLNVAVREAEERLRELRAQRSGVETLRPKAESIAQARAALAAAESASRSAHARASAARTSALQAERDARRSADLQKSGYLSMAERENADVKAQTLRRTADAAATDANAADAQVLAQRAVIEELLQKRLDPEYLIRVYDAQIAAVSEQLRQLRADAARTDIRVPAGGSVLRVRQESAQYVSAGAPLLEVGDLSSLEIVADALSSDAVRARVGQEMLVERGAGRVLRARVHAIEPSGFTKISPLGIEEQRVNIIGRFVERPSQIGDAYRLDVSIITWDGQNRTIVPLGALFRCGEEWCAFIVRGKSVSQQKLRVGHRTQTDAEILSGLAPGDRVVTYPPDTLRDGSRIAMHG